MVTFFKIEHVLGHIKHHFFIRAINLLKQRGLKTSETNKKANSKPGILIKLRIKGQCG